MNWTENPSASVVDSDSPRRAGTRAFQPTALAHLAFASTFILLYVGLEWASFLHEYKGLPLTSWNPGLGVALAVIILGGPGYGLALFAGIAVTEIVLLQSDLPWPVILGIAVAISTGYALVAEAARRLLDLDVRLHRLRDVMVLLAAAIVGALIVSLLSTGILLAAGHFENADILPAAVTFVVGDLIGIAVMTPLLLRLAERWSQRTFRRPPFPDVFFLGVAIAAVLWVVAVTETSEGSKFFYLLFFPVVIAAVRHGLDGACLGLAVTQLGLVGLLHFHGYGVGIFTEFQTLMVVLTATGLIVGVAVSERRAAHDAVRQAEALLHEKAAEAAQASRFMLVSSMASALAHEINQPLTAMRALARSVQHLLEESNRDLPRAGRNLATMLTHIDHVGGVVGHMRNFLRRGRPHVSTISVAKMLEEALTLARAAAAAQHIQIELDVPDGLPPVYGDRIQLEQVVLNLVRNAIEAIAETRRDDGLVRVAARRTEAGVEISVADNGPGIDKALVSRLFEPLTTSKQEGLGLGLPICASILEAHRGRIWLASGEPGATEFRLSLPLDPVLIV